MAKTPSTPTVVGITGAPPRTARDDVELIAGWIACGRREPCPFDASAEFREGWRLRSTARNRGMRKAASTSKAA
jgi:hypothetical protein